MNYKITPTDETLPGSVAFSSTLPDGQSLHWSTLDESGQPTGKWNTIERELDERVAIGLWSDRFKVSPVSWNRSATKGGKGRKKSEE